MKNMGLDKKLFVHECNPDESNMSGVIHGSDAEIMTRQAREIARLQAENDLAVAAMRDRIEQLKAENEELRRQKNRHGAAAVIGIEYANELQVKLEAARSEAERWKGLLEIDERLLKRVRESLERAKGCLRHLLKYDKCRAFGALRDAVEQFLAEGEKEESDDAGEKV